MNIEISVVPNSKNPEITKVSQHCYKVRVDVPALENKANKRLVEVLAKYFNVSKSSISIIKGLKSKNKIIEIDV